MATQTVLLYSIYIREGCQDAICQRKPGKQREKGTFDSWTNIWAKLETAARKGECTEDCAFFIEKGVILLRDINNSWALVDHQRNPVKCAVCNNPATDFDDDQNRFCCLKHHSKYVPPSAPKTPEDGASFTPDLRQQIVSGAIRTLQLLIVYCEQSSGMLGKRDRIAAKRWTEKCRTAISQLNKGAPKEALEIFAKADKLDQILTKADLHVELETAQAWISWLQAATYNPANTSHEVLQ